MCDFSRIDLLSEGETSESKSSALLQDLLHRRISVADLMGPLGSTAARAGLSLSPNISIPSSGSQAEPLVAEACAFFPCESESNATLLQAVHPPGYVNPRPAEGDDQEYDLVVIGAGAAGLISSIMGHWLGKRVALIERHAMGGDCLNTGCVPSKAVIACAKAFHHTKDLEKFGVHIEGKVSVDFGFVMQRMRDIRAKISHHDSVARYSKEFCQHVFVGNAVFGDGNVVVVTGDSGDIVNLKYKKAMIATGASASVPPLLRNIPHLSNSNFFNLTELPPRMVVIGCGPIGMELAQSMTRFGCNVVCLEMGTKLLPREDQQAVEILKNQLKSDGVTIHTGIKFVSIEQLSIEGSLYCSPWHLFKVVVEINGEIVSFETETILNATGRTPNVFGLGLDKVGVEWDNRKGVHVNEFLQTANPNIYSCGDCTSPFKFTHAADFQARVAVRNMFLGEVHSTNELLVPWCTYTDPEIAHVGKYEEELIADNVPFELFVRHLKDVDRCLCDGVDQGFVKIIMKAGTKQIIGATICGPNAGDMISQLTICIQYGITVPELAGTIHPYPTTQEAVRQACLGFNKYFKDRNGVPFLTLQKFMA